LLALAFLALCPGCTGTFESGERLYRDGDRLGALEIWRATPPDDADYARSRERIAVVEEEFEQLVVRYKQRARYFEEQGQLAESILDYRLALKLQPDDAETLDHVQRLARSRAERKERLMSAYRGAFEGGDLGSARDVLAELRRIDAFDPQLESEERRLEEALREELLLRLNHGRIRLAAGNHVAAQRAFHAVLELDGESVAPFDLPLEGFATDAEIRAEGFYQNAVAAESAGEVFAAIRHDERALRANPEHQGARRHLDLLRVRLTDEVEHLIELGRSAFRAEDLQRALDLWRRALLIDPSNERAQAYIRRAEEHLANLELLRSEPTNAAETD
jgi:tetratricopeptide (TPR) repeat protein